MPVDGAEHPPRREWGEMVAEERIEALIRH